MTTEKWVEVAVRVLAIIASWPVLAFFAVLLLRRSLMAALERLPDRMRRASLGAVSLEFDPVAVEALQDTARQAAEHFGENPAQLADFLGQQVSKLAQSNPRLREGLLAGTRILWVDDNPDHNLYEGNYLHRLDAEITTVTSTDEAVRLLPTGRFDLVISDMHRIEEGREEGRAGLKLLREIRSRGLSIPVVFYTSNAELFRRDKEISQLGAEATDLPQDLFEAVRQRLRQTPESPRRGWLPAFNKRSSRDA